MPAPPVEMRVVGPLSLLGARWDDDRIPWSYIPIENSRLPIPIGNVEGAVARATTVNDPASDRKSIPSALVRSRRRGSLPAHGQPLHLRTICRSPGHRGIRAIVAGLPCSTWPEGRHWQLSRARSSSDCVSPGAQGLRQPLFPTIRAGYRIDRDARFIDTADGSFWGTRCGRRLCRSRSGGRGPAGPTEIDIFPGIERAAAVATARWKERSSPHGLASDAALR